MKIKEVNIGIANYYGDVIEIHEDLKYFPNLYKRVLEHEFRHGEIDEKQLSNLEHFKLDFKPSNIQVATELFLFMYKRPRTWVQILPLYYTKERGIIYDTSWISTWLFISLIIGGVLMWLN